MRTLKPVVATPEQLAIFSRTRPGVELIRGAAGSGKTTTALLKLKQLTGFFVNRKRRAGDQSDVRILVLTFNRTLRGYIEELTKDQITQYTQVRLQINTFGKWAKGVLGAPGIIRDHQRTSEIRLLGQRLPLPAEFICDEVDYLLGRFKPAERSNYLTVRREGRGTSPRMDRALRDRLLNEVVTPYEDWKGRTGLSDWNDLAIRLAEAKLANPYDVVIADETQDFSANQIRAIMNQLAPDHSATFILDSAQRIYPRGFTWQEAGVEIRPENSKRLSNNYRNTVEIAKLAASIVKGITIDDDGTIPDPSACVRHGEIPQLIKGRFSSQLSFALKYISSKIDLEKESVAFLHPLGGRWLDAVRDGLRQAGFEFVELTRQSDWPSGPVNIGLSTIHSAKGLEFDHVIILGLNSEVTLHGTEEDDDRLLTLRRLLAMGIGRARKSVLLGCKPESASKLIAYMDPSSYAAVDL